MPNLSQTVSGSRVFEQNDTRKYSFSAILWHGFPDEMPTGVCACGALFLLVLLLAVIHVFVCQYVLQHEHGVLLAVPVGALQLGEHGADLRGVMRYVHLGLIDFQDRVLGAPRLRPVGLALVFFRGLKDDLLDVRLAISTIPIFIFFLWQHAIIFLKNMYA